MPPGINWQVPRTFFANYATGHAYLEWNSAVTIGRGRQETGEENE